jgi:hypothetical protein
MRTRALAWCLAASAWLGLVLARDARAQNMFYHEVAKQGRIYVFASTAEYERWEQSGALTRAIMRLAYGPLGETVLFDSETAVNLYNFKHDKPGEVFRQEKPPTMRFAWRDGKTSFETDKAVLNLSNRMQLRWIDEVPDDANQLPGTGATGQAKTSFRFQRVRTKLDGWVLAKQFEYEVQLDWADATSIVQDLNINWDVSRRRAFQLRFGQFKIPFGRQAITSAMTLQFVDRSIVSAEFEKIRDQGIQAWGLLGGSRFEYRAGMFNGNGRQRTLGSASTGNDNTAYQYDARLMFQPWGDVKYSESDFESSDRPLLAVAVNVESNDARVPAIVPVPTPAPPATFRRRVLGGDVAFKYRGFSAMGEYFERRLTPASASSFKSNGYHFQAGYFLRRELVEVAFRYASWDPSALVASNDRTEVGGALSYFQSKHNFKVNADFRRLRDQGRTTSDKEFRIQGQLLF